MFLVGINPFKSNNNNAIAAPGNVPAACPRFQCKAVYAYWTENSQTVKQFEFLFPAGKTTPAKYVPILNAMPIIFATASNGEPPFVGCQYLVYPTSYSTCIPSCGLDAAKNWQATQEVDLGAKAIFLSRDAAQAGMNCSPAAVPNQGKQVIPPNNINTKTPPQDPLSPPPG